MVGYDVRIMRVFFFRRVVPCVSLVLALLALPATAELPEKAKDALVRGVEAFKAGDYAEATAAFEEASSAAPDETVPHLYLGTAYSYQVIPNLDSPGNAELGRKAIGELSKVPPSFTGYVGALRQIASVKRNLKDFEGARAEELRVLEIAPDDAQSRYTVGVIDWTTAYKAAVAALAAEGFKDDGVGNARLSRDACITLRTEQQPVVAEAIDQLQRALDLKPDYSDAMSYLNLVYRRRADFACGDAAVRQKDVALASDWARRAIQARKAETTNRSAEAPHP